jgi:hypothetical protein
MADMAGICREFFLIVAVLVIIIVMIMHARGR